MKRILLIVMICVVGACIAYSHDYFLLSDSFFLKKGETLQVHLLVGDHFKDLQERKYQSSHTGDFHLYEGGKKHDLRASSTDSLAPVLSRKMDNAGLALVAMERKASEIELDKAKFLEYLREEGLSDMTQLVETQNKNSYKEKYTRYLKTLVMVEKPVGGLHNQKTDHQLEILLLQNPYKLKYGDDMIAEILFKGKPLANKNVEVLTKSLNGSVFNFGYHTDTNGRIYFKLNRTGTWMVRTVHMQPTTDKDADFESFWASYTFGFKY
ncbi:MAG TPA: DUF4198 domain-containing protein [Daejeonella sp.]|nr:DUF4198 domain-containing protein [Daejeonella sp.]